MFKFSVFFYSQDQSIAKTFFVTFCHTTDYDELLETLKLMCRFFLVDEEPVRLEILKKLGHRDFEQPTNRENLDDYTDEECIYKSSPFYQDGFKIYQKELKKSNSEGHPFLELFLKKIIAFAPWWTGITHKPKTDSGANVILPYRFHTGLVECAWGRMKESLRASIVENGKPPLPAARLISIFKEKLEADLVRYNNKIPRTRLNARKGTFKRARIANDNLNLRVLTTTTPGQIDHTPAKVLRGDDTDMTHQNLRNCTAQWKRVAKPDITPRTSQIGKKTKTRRLFERSFSAMNIESEPIVVDLSSQASGDRTTSPSRPTIRSKTNITQGTLKNEQPKAPLSKPSPSSAIVTNESEPMVVESPPGASGQENADRTTRPSRPTTKSRRTKSQHPKATLPKRNSEKQLSLDLKPKKTVYRLLAKIWQKAKTLNEHVYISSMPYEGREVSIDLKDLMSLYGQCLYDTTVQFCIVQAFIETPKYYVVDYVDGGVILGNYKSQDPDLQQAYMSQRREKFQPVVSYLDRTLVIPHVDGIHFYLVVINVQEKQLFLYDSLRRVKSAEHFLKEFLITLGSAAHINGIQEILGEENEWKSIDVSCAQQSDDKSCGVYCIEFARRILSGQDFEEDVDVDELRQSFFDNVIATCSRKICRGCASVISDRKFYRCPKCTLNLCEACLVYLKTTSDDYKCNLCYVR